MAEVLLSPLVDFLFKRIFGDEKNADLLIHFLNAVFEETGEPLVESVEILNPYIDKDAVTDKMSVLDIRARAQARTLVNIEVQIRDEKDMRERTLYYWAKLYEEQLAEGNQYQALHKAITVNILKFNEMDNKRYHNVFHVREDTDGSLLTDRLEVHFLELPKLEHQAMGVEPRLVRWLTFLTMRSKEQLAELVKGDVVMEKAMTTLEFLSQDKQTRMLYEARQKALHDYASAIGNAEQRGLEQGIEQGIERGIEQGIERGIEQGIGKGKLEAAKNIARALLAAGVDWDIIAKTTGLSREQIEEG